MFYHRSGEASWHDSIMVSVYRGTGCVSDLALLNVSDVLVCLATLAGTGRASLRGTFEQIFVYIWVLV